MVFGHVISGQQFVTEMENQKVDTNHRPYADVRIMNSGELVRISKGETLLFIFEESVKCVVDIRMHAYANPSMYTHTRTHLQVRRLRRKWLSFQLNPVKTNRPT